MAKLQSRSRGGASPQDTHEAINVIDISAPFTSANAFELTKPPASSPFGYKHLHTAPSEPLGSEYRVPQSGNRCARWVIAIVSLSLVLLMGAVLASKTALPLHQNFITVQGTQFMDGCSSFYITGFNVDNIVEAAIPEVSRRQSATKPPGRQMVADLLSTVAKSNLNVMRIWGHTTDPAHPFQLSPGVYNEEVFQALDFVIAQAARAGLRVVISLADNWRYRGGVDEMVDWSSSVGKREDSYSPLVVMGDVTPDMLDATRGAYEAQRKALFFTDTHTKTIYKNHVSKILNRKNTYTGKRYKEDPTIMSFNLLNEARCDTTQTSDCSHRLQTWVEEMARYFKSIDSKHLLTVGTEGFWGFNDPHQTHNPGASGGSRWASETGQDFVANHNIPEIDYSSCHSWPDNFNVTAYPAFQDTWLEKHAEDATMILKKPLLLEEIGKKLVPPTIASDIKTLRDPVFSRVQKSVERSVAGGHSAVGSSSSNTAALAGSMFWEMDFQVYDASPQSPYGIKPTDSTFDLIAAHAKRMHNFMHTTAQGSSSSSSTSGWWSGCWAGRQYMGGWVRRCERLSQTECSGGGKKNGGGGGSSNVYQTVWDEKKGQLKSSSSSSSDLRFGSQVECCRAGFGAFDNGCSTMLI